MTLNAEQALIGALMIAPAAVKDCGDLRAEMFTDALNGRLYLEFVRAHDWEIGRASCRERVLIQV